MVCRGSGERGATMTSERPEPVYYGHCGHECVCSKYKDYTNTGATPNRECNGETWCYKLCPHDTRKSRGPIKQKAGAFISIHCPLCGWHQVVPLGDWLFQSSEMGHGYTCGSGKCPSHTRMVACQKYQCNPCAQHDDAAIRADEREKVLREKFIELGEKFLPYTDENSPLYCCAMSIEGQLIRTAMKSLRGEVRK